MYLVFYFPVVFPTPSRGTLLYLTINVINKSLSFDFASHKL